MAHPQFDLAATLLAELEACGEAVLDALKACGLSPSDATLALDAADLSLTMPLNDAGTRDARQHPATDPATLAGAVLQDCLPAMADAIADAVAQMTRAR